MLHRIVNLFRVWWHKWGSRERYPLEQRESQFEYRGQPFHEGSYFEDPRDQMDVNEFFEAEQSRSIRGVKIEDVSENVCLSEKVRRLTPFGIVSEDDQTLLRTTTGQIVTPQQLNGGGQCWVCKGYSDREHFYLCSICGRGLCHLHVYSIDEVLLCPVHARQALYNLDTWSRRDLHHDNQ